MSSHHMLCDTCDTFSLNNLLWEILTYKVDKNRDTPLSGAQWPEQYNILQSEQ